MTNPDTNYKLDVNGSVSIRGTLEMRNQAINNVYSIYVNGNVSALSFTDRTPGYTGDALAELALVRNTGRNIDHKSLPAFARKRIIHDNGQVQDARDIGAMISILTAAVQQLTSRLQKLEAKQ